MRQGAIIGGGIAGLALAIAARQRGMHLAVYEKDPNVRSGDHLLWIAPNGQKILAHLGVLDPIRAAAVEQDAMQFCNRELKVLSALSGDTLRSGCGFPIIAVRRQVIWQALAAKLQAMRGEVLFGQSLQQVQRRGTRIDLHGLGQSSPITVDYLIGADGMGSLVRSLIAPSSVIAYQGIRTWLGKSHTPLAPRFAGLTREIWGQGTRFVATAMDDHTVYWSALERAPDYEANATPIPPDTLERLRRLFHTYDPSIDALLAAAVPESLMRCNFGVVAGLESFHQGTIALIGDAAHGMPPNMGQGASLALEDAVWVADLLARHDEPEAAFAKYSQTRQRRVGEMRQLANAMNTFFQPEGRLASALRDSVAAWTPDRLTARRMRRLYQPAVPSGVCDP